MGLEQRGIRIWQISLNNFSIRRNQ
jgi:hypothetical protein